MATFTTKRIEALNAPGRYSDGNNLYLQVTKTGGKSWLFIYRWNGSQKEMGLGAIPCYRAGKCERGRKGYSEAP